MSKLVLVRRKTGLRSWTVNIGWFQHNNETEESAVDADSSVF